MAPPPSSSPFTRRLAIGAAILALLGFGLGALLSQGVARFAALPEGSERTLYVDAEAPGAGPGPDLADATPPPVVDRVPARPRVWTAKQYSDVILRRNIFDSSAVYDPDAALAAAGGGECRSDANVRVIATVVADLPTWSSALVQVGGRDGKASGFVVGDPLGSEGRIVSIEPKKVCVDGGTCFCSGTDSPLAGKASASPTEAGTGVEKLAENRYGVDQSVIDEAMSNFEVLATQMRATAHKGADGQVDGFRLQSIKKGSLFSKLGITNGDIVHGVNGRDLTSYEAGISALQALKSERSFSFDITRKGQKMTLEYEVR